MSEDYVTEAEALSDIYDDSEFSEIFVPYSNIEKRVFLAQKSRFNSEDKGKFVIVQITRKNKHLLSQLFLVNRTITKRFWWSHDARYAMKFISKEAAERRAAKYRFNNIRVKCI